ncbi:MAG: glutamate--tRNA ligase [candidate division WOR-3 bacterium]
MVRVRFAPSPTGYLHVGGARTALYNWLFARKNGGKFILRIEDTDRTRYVPGSVDDIMESLRWLGLVWDEGPYFQSERIQIYREHANLLLEKGHAYRCFCSPERLDELRKEQMARGLKPGYDRKCRSLPAEESSKLAKEGKPFVIRLKVPLDREIVFEDYLRGTIKVKGAELEDIILLKSDGFPTYHLANVVDDHLMGITHVMRADEWIPSTPYHVFMYEAFGWEAPVFAHLPVILAPDGKGKLSKRHGATSVLEFRKMGILPEALVNFLALLGWSPGGDREIISLEEMIELFDLRKVGKRGSVFDFNKLYWMNSYYIRNKDLKELLVLSKPFYQDAGIELQEKDDNTLLNILSLYRERVKTLSELPAVTKYFFTDDIEYDPEGLKKHLSSKEKFLLIREFTKTLVEIDSFTKERIEQKLREFATEKGVHPKELIHPIRILLTGETIGPGLFELMEVLGREACIRKLERGISILENAN